MCSLFHSKSHNKLGNDQTSNNDDNGVRKQANNNMEATRKQTCVAGAHNIGAQVLDDGYDGDGATRASVKHTMSEGTAAAAEASASQHG